MIGTLPSGSLRRAAARMANYLSLVQPVFCDTPYLSRQWQFFALA